MFCGHDMVDGDEFAKFQLSLAGCPDLRREPIPMEPGLDPNRASLLGLIDVPLIFVRQALQVTQEEISGNQNINTIRKNTCVLLKLLWTTRHRQCKQPQDRFYALRNIALDIDRNILMPNYNDELWITYAKVTLAMISHSGNLNVMFLCRGPGSAATQGQQRPSWAPDFDLHMTDPNDRLVSGMMTNFVGMTAFFDPTRGSIARPRHSDDYYKMTVTGYDIGVVNATSPVRWIDGTIQQARAIVESRTSDQTSREIFWRTLITDRTFDSRPASTDVEGAEFDRWWDIHTNSTEDMTTEDVNLLIGSVNHYNRAYYLHGARRMLFATTTGLIGLGPLSLQNGDHVYLLSGGKTAFTLRPHNGNYWVMGETYVHGVMRGELWKNHEETGVRQTEFVLV